MSASTPIAILVESMLGNGFGHDEVVRAVEAAETNGGRTSNKTARGTRLDPNWRPSEVHIAYATGLHMPSERIKVEAEKFRNYWTAKSGSGATKRDWDATWRNWILTAMEGRNATHANRPGWFGAPAIAGRPATGPDAVLAGMGRLALRLAQTGGASGSNGKETAGADAPEDDDADGRRT